MAGHNKWTQIKRKKGAADAVKSKLFSLLTKTITLEAKRSGGDRNGPGLRRAIDKARAANMPNENIDRAVNRATAGQDHYEEVLYEGYGPGGAALMIEGITDNGNRTSQEIKRLLAEHGGSLASQGAARWLFEPPRPAAAGEKENGWEPKSFLEINEESAMRNLVELVDKLEEHPDIKRVGVNVHLPEEDNG